MKSTGASPIRFRSTIRSEYRDAKTPTSTHEPDRERRRDDEVGPHALVVLAPPQRLDELQRHRRSPGTAPQRISREAPVVEDEARCRADAVRRAGDHLVAAERRRARREPPHRPADDEHGEPCRQRGAGVAACAHECAIAASSTAAVTRAGTRTIAWIRVAQTATNGDQQEDLRPPGRPRDRLGARPRREHEQRVEEHLGHQQPGVREHRAWRPSARPRRGRSARETSVRAHR